MNYYEHHIGDYMKDAAHLSMLEDAAYRRLLDAYYTREIPLPADAAACCRLIRASGKAEFAAVDAVLREFFVLQDDGWHQKRCDREIARYLDKVEKAKQAAFASVASRRASAERTLSERSTDVQPRAHVPDTSNQTPVTNNQEIPTALSGKPDPDALEVLNFLNAKASRAYRPTRANLDMIRARLRDGATVADCKQVIAKKTREWGTDDKMAQYLRPLTLFNRSKFDQYTGELVNDPS